jgi:hypothetical protein
MTRAGKSENMQTSMRDLADELADVLRSLGRALFDSYRPERHYMRGPGPKSRARHAPASTIPQPAC